MSKINANNISHLSIIGSKIILNKTLFINRPKGIIDKKAIPSALYFLVFNNLKIPNIHQRYIIEIIDIIAPIVNIEISFIKILNI